MSVYKKRPELLDLLRRRGVSFTSWCSEFGLVSWDDVIAKCRELDVIAPDAELGVSFTQLPVSGFSPEVKEELKTLVDEVHDKVEELPSITVCCREAGHEGPCNGIPNSYCNVYDPFTKTVMTANEFIQRPKKRKKAEDES